MMAWIILVLAGVFEVAWAIGLEYSHGFTKLVPSIWTVLAMLVSFGLLGLSVKTLPVGTAYSIWVGIGTVGTVLLGILLFNEPVQLMRMIFVALVITGIIGLKLTAQS